jgi:hypothetical protein
MLHLRQRQRHQGAAIWRAQTQVLRSSCPQAWSPSGDDGGTRYAVRGARCAVLLAAGCWCWLLVLVPEPGCWAVGCGLGLDAAHGIWHVVHAGAGVRGVSASEHQHQHSRRRRQQSPELQVGSKWQMVEWRVVRGAVSDGCKLVPSPKWRGGELCGVWFRVQI